jgi:hypothetical protein
VASSWWPEETPKVQGLLSAALSWVLLCLCLQDKPLPAPPAAAVAVRELALEIIEQWHECWGLHYPQVGLHGTGGRHSKTQQINGTTTAFVVTSVTCF